MVSMPAPVAYVGGRNSPCIQLVMMADLIGSMGHSFSEQTLSVPLPPPGISIKTRSPHSSQRFERCGHFSLSMDRPVMLLECPAHSRKRAVDTRYDDPASA
jgi:hypothetical protein